MIQKEKKNFMTLKKLQMKIGENLEEKLTYFVEVSHVNRYHTQEIEKVLMTLEEHCFSRLQEQPNKSNHAIFSLKTSKGYYTTTKGTRSLQSLVRFMNSGMMLNGMFSTVRILEFPKVERESILSDILESSVNQSYYLTEKLLNEIVIDVDPKDIPTNSIPIREGIKLGYRFATVGDSVNIQRPKCNNRRGRVGDQICNTLQTSDTFAVVEEDLRMRKLTPLEFWRLQGFTDE